MQPPSPAPPLGNPQGRWVFIIWDSGKRRSLSESKFGRKKKAGITEIAKGSYFDHLSNWASFHNEPQQHYSPKQQTKNWLCVLPRFQVNTESFCIVHSVGTESYYLTVGAYTSTTTTRVFGVLAYISSQLLSIPVRIDNLEICFTRLQKVRQTTRRSIIWSWLESEDSWNEQNNVIMIERS